MFTSVERAESDSTSPFLEFKSTTAISILSDRLTACHKGNNSNISEIACVRCNRHAFPTIPNSNVYYFEVFLKDEGIRSDLVIGLTDKAHQMTKIPGATSKSYGLKSDGKAIHNTHTVKTTPTGIRTGCTVGCGLNLSKGEIFYTLNGKSLGTMFKDVETREYFATCGLASRKCEVTFNFTMPFQFDLLSMVTEEQELAGQEIAMETVSPADMHDLVHFYLLHYGYVETLSAFDEAAGIDTASKLIQPKTTYEGFKRRAMSSRLSDPMEQSLLLDTGACAICGESNPSKICQNCLRMMVEQVDPTSSPLKRSLSTPPITRKDSEKPSLNLERCDSVDISSFYLKEAAQGNRMEEDVPPQKDDYMESLEKRGEIRNLIKNGAIDEALAAVGQFYPAVLEDRAPALYALYIQGFIELINKGEAFLALQYARAHLTQFKQEPVAQGTLPDYPLSLIDAIGLLCYKDPSTTCMQHLLTAGQREQTADLVNKAILEHEGQDSESKLQVLLKQLVGAEEVHQASVSLAYSDRVSLLI